LTESVCARLDLTHTHQAVALLRGKAAHDTVSPNRMFISKNTHLVAIRRNNIHSSFIKDVLLRLYTDMSFCTVCTI
jgi:hypothetical protein